jgi:hypothetical protein
VGIDYHVELDRHYYSVPYRYAGQKVNVRYTATSVEVFKKGERIANHPRSPLSGRHTTVDAHLPPPIGRWRVGTSTASSTGRPRSVPRPSPPLSRCWLHASTPSRATALRWASYGLGLYPWLGAPGGGPACAPSRSRSHLRSIASILKRALERQTPTRVQANLPPDRAMPVLSAAEACAALATTTNRIDHAQPSHL